MTHKHTHTHTHTHTYTHVHTHTHTHTHGRSPLDERSARHTDLYLTTHNIHKRQTSMTPRGIESAIPANERPQTTDRATTGIGLNNKTL
jgi:hypothetical protein